MCSSVLLDAASACPGRPPRRRPRPTRAGQKLLAEGDTLADKGDTTEAEIRYQQAMEKLLPGLRSCPSSTRSSGT